MPVFFSKLAQDNAQMKKPIARKQIANSQGFSFPFINTENKALMYLYLWVKIRLLKAC
jgi:hypothetical protein